MKVLYNENQQIIKKSRPIRWKIKKSGKYSRSDRSQENIDLVPESAGELKNMKCPLDDLNNELDFVKTFNVQLHRKLSHWITHEFIHLSISSIKNNEDIWFQ